jgi:hypothetical protein
MTERVVGEKFVPGNAGSDPAGGDFISEGKNDLIIAVVHRL